MTPMGDSTIIITLDGPAATGKSSVGVEVARQLDIPFISSGLFYRTATLLALRQDVSPDNQEGIITLLEQHKILFQSSGTINRILVDGVEVSQKLHTDQIDENVSAVSSHPGVRSWVQSRLQGLEPPFVVEGRDMGSIVFPNADIKFYLTASSEARASRRVSERSSDLNLVGDALARRDLLDARQLKPAGDALHIDTDGLSLVEVTKMLLVHVAAVNKA